MASGCDCLNGYLEREILYEEGTRSWRLDTCSCWVGRIARSRWRVRHEAEMRRQLQRR